MQTEVQKALSWANELSEAWVGTALADIIDVKKKYLESNLVSVQELIEICKYAQKELDEY